MTNLDKTKEREAWHKRINYSKKGNTSTFTLPNIEILTDYWLERMALHEQKVRDQISEERKNELFKMRGELMAKIARGETI